MPPSTVDDASDALARATSALESSRLDADDDATTSSTDALKRENAELKRELHALRSSERAVRFADDPPGPRRTLSSSSLTSPIERPRLAGFRTKSHKFVVRACDDAREGEGSRRERDDDSDDESDAKDSGDADAAIDDAERGRRACEEPRRVAPDDDDESVVAGEGASQSAPEEGLKAAFELVLANDEGVRVLEPRDRRIRTSQKSSPHSNFSWLQSPKNALVVKKIHDSASTARLMEAVDVLRANGVTPWLERTAWDELEALQSSCKTWDDADESFRLYKIIDFVVVLGGDGTILWASKYFPKAMPPVLAFAMGSLGFLTAHKIEDMPKTLADVCLGNFTLSMRNRLVAQTIGADGAHSEWRPVLNEVLIDRGPKPVMVELDLAVDGYHVTKVAADGVILSSPTGSTAYSLAAGGSMVHPGVPALCITPICPHSLSFRPIVLPDSVVVTIRCPTNARNTAWAAFDGKFQTELARGDAVVVRVASFPIPVVCSYSENNDWFAAVKQGLLWNARGADQKPLEIDARDPPS
jgi:NAD+ kinase/solute carrier family 25 oxoglutarate transporter 11